MKVLPSMPSYDVTGKPKMFTETGIKVNVGKPRAIVCQRVEDQLRFLSESDLSWIASMCMSELQDRDIRKAGGR